MTAIPVAVLEYTEGGNTLWVHNRKGATVLRVQCSGKIKIHSPCENICAHSDIRVPGDIEICVPERKKRK